MRAFGLIVVFALVVGGASVAQPPGGPLTPEQRAKLREQFADKAKNLTPEQRKQLREKLAERAAKTKPKPVPAAKPAAPRVPPKPAPPPVPVRPEADVVAFINAEIAAQLAQANLTPSPTATEAEFLRRVTLDLTGVIPTAAQARQFLDSTDPEKRAKLVEELLADPKFGTHLADIWTAKLLPRLSDNRFVDRESFREWLAQQFNENVPWDQLTRTILTATGSPDDNPATAFYLANRSADKLTDAVGTHFLGLQIQCAQCHNHPYSDWKQTDYWGVAAFFEKVVARPPLPPQQLANRPNAPPPGVNELARRSPVKDFFPESTQDVPPQFLDGYAPALPANQPYRPALADWLTTGRTPYFEQAFVNRVWAQLFGRGLVDPVDDLDPDRAASHPELFAELSAQFRASGYDVKRLYRTLALSDAYQRSSTPTSTNAADKTRYSHMTVKVLTPEQLFDSLAAIVPMPGGKAATGPKLTFNRNAGPRDQFVQFFLAGADMANPAEYESGVPQALRLMNSRLMNNPRAVNAFAGFTFRQTLDNLFLATLARRPTDAEVERMTAYHAANGKTLAATADILWVLLNTSEFMLIR